MAFCSLSVTLLQNHSPSPDLRSLYAAEADEQGITLDGGWGELRMGAATVDQDKA